MSVPNEVVIGATRRNLEWVVTDENGVPINVTGGSARLQATSLDIPAVTIDVAGTIVDGPNGVFRWTGLGDPAVYVSEANMDGRTEATWAARVKFTDASSKTDFGALFDLVWRTPPAVP